MIPRFDLIITANMVAGTGFICGSLLVLIYFQYDRHPFFRSLGDLFMSFTIGKRDKRDILLLAIAPYSIAIFALLARLVLF